MDFSLTGLIDIIHNYKMVMSVSPALENIIIEEINSGKAKSVLILGAEGFSGNLLKAVQAHKDIKFSFMTNISADSSCIFLLNEIYKEVYREEFYKSYKDEEVAINGRIF